MTADARRSRRYTDEVHTRWPYAPIGTRIAFVPPSWFQGDWGGKWDHANKICYVNNALPTKVADGIVAHECAHGRWSTPLPDMYGEEGAALLAMELFDELRVEYYAIIHAPWVRDDIRAWVNHGTPGKVPVRNVRGAALAYGSFAGRAMTGTCTWPEIAHVTDQFTRNMGPGWCEQFNTLLRSALDAPAGSIGTLMGLARDWDRTAVAGYTPQDDPDRP